MKVSGQHHAPTGLLSDKDPRWPSGGKLRGRHSRSARTFRRREKSCAADANWTTFPQISCTYPSHYI